MPTQQTDLEKLTKLGGGAKVERQLEVFPSHSHGLTVRCECKEFTCFCPLTHQPDFAEIVITYCPKDWVVESKSLKLYMESYRNEGVFHEHLAVDIAQDFMDFAAPHWVRVEVKFNVRGGIAISAECLKQND